MTPSEDRDFTQFLLQKAAEAEALGYRPTLFKKMLGSQGGAATVRQLLAKGKPSDGFERLLELKRLDLTVEALVVETMWRPLIDPILVYQAEQLLTKCKYHFTPFTGTAPSSGASQARVGAGMQSPELGTEPPPSPASRKKTRSYSEFCDFLGAPLVNPLDRWCGYNRKRGFAVFTIWADHLQGDRYVLWDAMQRSGDTRIGASELKRVLREVISAGHAAYGIRCEARDVTAVKRERGHFDEDQLLVLCLKQETASENVVATVCGIILATDVAAGRQSMVAPFDSAIDDLGNPPPGNLAPGRSASSGGRGYRRDPGVREYVIRRSQGRCEYCGALGFETEGGSHYVEAHHIIALSAQGPDTVKNVIALCPAHHREAHYGLQAEDLEQKFLKKLQKIAS